MASPTVRASSRTAGGSAASAVGTKPTGTADNDILLACLYKENNAAVTAPGSPGDWTLEAQTSNTDHFGWLYSRRAASEGASWTWSWTGSTFNQILVTAIQGAETSGGYTDGTVDHQVRTSTSARTYPDTSLTTTTTDTILVWCGLCFTGVSAASLTQPTGYTIDLGGTGTGGADVLDATKAEAASGAKSATGAAWTGSDVSRASAFLIAIKSPAAGATDQPMAKRWGGVPHTYGTGGTIRQGVQVWRERTVDWFRELRSGRKLAYARG